METNPPLSVLILAAGKGTRMASDLPKVLHPIHGKPMICHVIDTAHSLKAERVISIIGYESEKVEAALTGVSTEFAYQIEQLGTGHAVLQCKELMENFKGNILVLSGDVPLISNQTLKKLISVHISSNSTATLLTADFKNLTGYGRVIRNIDNSLKKIVEHKDANEEELKVNEINSGIYIFDSQTLFSMLSSIKNDNAQGEYYLPDVLKLILAENGKVAIDKTDNIPEIQGVNTCEQLAELNEYFESQS